jgi:glycosyltransferase involved in cell wall biosynthesis
MPIVSIITPHYQRPRLLAEMIRSVQAQTFADWELLVVDDQSTAADWEAIQQHSADARIRLIRRYTGLKGPNTCRNLGLELSRGRFVLFLDSDDLLAPWCLKQRLAAFDNAPDTDFLVFQTLIFEATPGDRNQLWNDLGGEKDLQRFLAASPPWCMSSPLWRRESILALGGLDPQLRYGTDSELHTRALVRNLQYRKYPTLLPDMFVRRDDTPRFNRTLSPELLDAQLARVAAGRKLLMGVPNNTQSCQLWQKQYFGCLEFLIYNAPKPRPWTRQLLSDWRLLPGSRAWVRLLLQIYAFVGLCCRRRFYFLLRIMRRLVLLLTGGRLLQQDTGFHTLQLPASVFSQLLAALSDKSTVHPTA